MDRGESGLGRVMEAGSGEERGEGSNRGREQGGARRSSLNSLEAGPSGSESTSSYQDGPEFKADPYMRHSISRNVFGLRYHGISEYRLGKTRSHPVPPACGCFSAPKFQAWVAFESILALVFTNCFWVGLWDLLNNTVFPVDTSRDMYSLIIVGVFLLYVTNSLYEPPHPAMATPKTRSEKYDVLRNTQRTGPNRGGSAANERRQQQERAEKEEKSRLRRVSTSKRLLARLHPIFDPNPSLDIREGPFIPPRLEFWRLMERIVASFGSVFIWVGTWDQIDMNLLPLVCSYKACGDCTAYGRFPCAWYKIGFTLGGLVGMYFTRQLYQDYEVAYSARGAICWQCSPKPKEEEKGAAQA